MAFGFGAAFWWVRSQFAFGRPLAHYFSRNLAPDFTHYLSERPEMSSQNESSRKAKPKQERRIKWHRKKRRKKSKSLT